MREVRRTKQIYVYRRRTLVKQNKVTSLESNKSHSILVIFVLLEPEHIYSISARPAISSRTHFTSRPFVSE